MDIHLGKLEFVPVKDRPELTAPPVLRAIAKLPGGEKVGVAEIDPGFSDTAAFCSAYGIGMDWSANCVILEAERAGKVWLAACVILGSTRADVNGLARKTLGARRVSFAPMEKAVAESGMEYGAITPIGLPEEWPVLVDKAVADAGYVVVGSGVRKSKLAIPGNLFAALPNVTILDGLGKAAERQ